MLALLATFACATCIAPPLAAQDVTIMPPVLFELPPDNPYQPNQPDTPPTLRKDWAPPFPANLLKTKDPRYVILVLTLGPKGRHTNALVFNNDKSLKKNVDDALKDMRCAPAKKNGNPVKSVSWTGIIYNPASASENNADATPRILKVAPIFITKKQFVSGKNQDTPTVPGTIEIDTDGAAKNLKFKKDTPLTQALRPAIERSLAKWQFAPARKNGQPVKAALTIDFVLQLNPVETLKVLGNIKEENDQQKQQLSQQTPAMSGGPVLKPADRPPNYKPARPDPNALHNAMPKYPNSMKDSFVTGEVVVEFVVDTNGKVRSPKIIHSNDPHFEKPAMDSVMKLRFTTPATQDGKPVEETQRMTFNFKPPNS